MNNLTITEVSKVTAITGIAKIRTPEGELQDLKVGDVLQPGTVVLLADASVFLFEPSMPEAGSAIAELPANQQPAMPAMGAAGGEGGQTLAQINAMQQAILSGQDPTQAFEAAAAGVAADAGGGGPGSGNDGFISIDRVGDSTIASAGYDTTAFTGADIQIPELTSSVPENAPTLVTPDVNTVSEDNPATGNVLANDSDADDVLTVGSFVVGGTAYAAGDTATLNGIGTVVINPDGSYVFTPVANWNGAVPEVTYTTNTGASSTLNIEVTAINDNAQIIGTSSGTTVEAGGVNNGTLGDNFADGTLTVADNDTGENTFAPVSGAALNGTYGTFTFDTATGYWTYTLDNGRAATQALNAGDGVSDSLTVSSLDGTDSQEITVNITGSNDNAQITGIATGDVTEDVGVSAGHLTTSGSLDVADVDEGEAVFQTPVSLTGSNGYGVFTFNPANGDWTYSADNSQSAIQGLKNGESLTDSLTVTSLDGTANQVITVTIHGADDTAVITGTSSGTTVEAGGVNNGTLGDNFADGTLTVADNDTGENTFAPVSGAALNGTYGTFTFDTATGYWTYTLDNSRAATQALNAGDGVSDSLTVSSLDGTDSQVITVNITGSNDNAQITGIATGDVTEDVGVSAGHLTTSGSLDVADVDEGEAVFQTPASLTGSNGYGVFTFNPANGDWTYSADNSQSAIQGLKNGESLTDSLTVTSLDGTASQVITVTIHGTNDAPVLDLDANDSAATGYNYATSYTANSAPVAIADVDSLITDLDSTTLSGATITLANSQIGDLLSVSGIPAGLGITATVNNNVVTLSGSASLASYSAAIEAITFSSTNNTVTDNRVINVVVYDDTGAPSNTATTTISVLTSPISYEDDDTGWQMNKSPNSDTFQMRAKGGKITLLQGGTIYWDILVNDSNHDASISFALGKFDESMAASYEKLYDADGQMIFRVYVTAIDSTVLAADDQFGITVNNADGDMLLLNSDEFVRPHSNYNVDYSDPNTFDTGTVGDSSADNDWLSTYALDGSDVNGGEFSTGTLFTQPGVTQHYGSMDDIAYGTVGNDQLYGDAGNDFIAGRAGNDILHGGDGNDTLVGGYGNDELHGDSGNDKLYGNENNDILIGGQGDDILTGGDGIDTFTWTADDVASGPFIDTITDFSISATDGDKLDLSAVLTGVEADLDNYLQIVSDGAGNAEISVYKNGDALSSTPPSPDMTIIIEGHGGSDAELEALKNYLETDGGLIH